MTRISLGIAVAVFGSVLTVIVAAAMGTILLFMTPGTATPTINVNLGPLVGIGQFGAIVVAGVLGIIMLALAGGETV